MGGQRILNGDVLYRDFFQYVPPGTDLIYAALFKLLGTRIWVTGLVTAVLGTIFACISFSISRKLMNARLAVLATAVFLIFIYGEILNATHHWFAVLSILFAVRACMEQVSSKRVAIAGGLLGLAAFFNQVHGGMALGGFAIFILCNGIRIKQRRIETIKLISILLTAFALMLLLLSSYYIATVGMERLWYSLFVYVVKYLPYQSTSLAGVPFIKSNRAAVFALGTHGAAYILLPAIYGISLWRCWLSRRDESFPWQGVALLSVVGLALLLDVAMSLTWLRLFTVSLPGVVLAVWIVNEMGGLRDSVLVAAAVVLGCGAVHQIVAKNAVASIHAELPGGLFAADPKTYEKLRWMADRTHPGDWFLQAGWPGVYVPLQVRNPLFVPTVGRGDVGPDEDIERSIQVMKAKRVRYVLWPRVLDADCKPAGCDDFLSPFRSYLRQSYRPIRTFQDGDVFWQRQDDSVALVVSTTP
jgi:Dolichyl-phosphate-mannose-protein mannosyltransferase